MMCKISLTTKCNAHCKTCPVWEYPGQHIKLAEFKLLWLKMKDKRISKVMLNNTGDCYIHPEVDQIFDYIEDHPIGKWVAMTTNAAAMHRIPKIDELVISFNGGTKETYEYTTGLSFDRTVQKIKAQYDAIGKMVRKAEIHCLMWEHNKGTEEDLLKLWKDFPGNVRVSYKYDNQQREDYTIDEYKLPKRIMCDYLDMLCVLPSGDVNLCAHDFTASELYGNILVEDIDEILTRRQKKKREHYEGLYNGVCKHCNYNTPLGDRIKYLKQVV